jgi:HEPN domain-containing protein
MCDRKTALMMLELASDDLTVLEEMSGSSRISDRAFGFHAQQAVEKALKAWLAFAGVDYPKTHDLAELLALLLERGQPIPDAFRRLDCLTDFAVLIRYTISETLVDKIDRPALVLEVSELVEHVRRHVGESA